MIESGKYGRYLPALQTAIDCFVVNGAFAGMAAVFGLFDSGHLTLLWCLINAVYLPMTVPLYLTHHRRMMRSEKLIKRAFLCSLAILIIYAALLAFCNVYIPSFGFFAALFGTLLAAMTTAWLIELATLKKMRRLGRNSRYIVIVGTGPTAMELTRRLSGDKGYGFHIMGYFDDTLHSEFKDTKGPYLGNIDDLEKFCRSNRVHEIYFTLSSHNASLLNRVIHIADSNFCRFYYIPLMSPRLRQSFYMQTLNGSIPAVSVHPTPLRNPLNMFIKRTFDILFSGIALIFSPIIFIPVAIAIKLDSPGPIFFRQKRTGYMGNEFYCYKFRTMKVNKEADNLQATKDDNRKTKLGNFLRHSSIDELPQFWNVLKGDMSVVGPRPHMLAHTEEYRKIIDQYMVRHLVKPGITGWAQVLGYRGATDELWQMESRVESDVWYIENWSFLLDLKIIIKTITNAIHGEENAY